MAEGHQQTAGFCTFFEVALGGCTQGYLAVPSVIISKIKANQWLHQKFKEYSNHSLQRFNFSELAISEQGVTEDELLTQQR